MTRERGYVLARPARGDAGSATVWVLAGCLLIGVAALVPLVTGGIALARHRAAVAADAAALAAAAGRRALGTTAAGCHQAAILAAMNGGSMASCVAVPCGPPGRGVASVQVQVTVKVSLAGLPIGSGAQVTSNARAGPSRCLASAPTAGGLARSLEPSGAPRGAADR